MLFHPGLTVILVVVVMRTAARPWDDSSFLSNDIYNGYPQDVIQDLALGRGNSAYGDDSRMEDTPMAKRFSMNSFRLFRPFYHSQKSGQGSRNFHKRGNSLNDLITRLLALKGNVYGGRAASMRFGPGGK
ncbi:uncharacterized protein LOC135473984 [Liolophura sinensis]|uniref:uncharacterized protein LOC135473984 n=1 Tax=Liolophura sinensis TaxID=3198878 RepID=UPI0031590DB2